MGRYEGYLMDTGGVMRRLDVGQSLHQPSRHIVLHYPGNAGKACHLPAKLRQPMSRLNGPTRFRFLDCRHVVGGFKAGDRPPADVREKLVLQPGKDFLVAFRPCRALLAEPVAGHGLKGIRQVRSLSSSGDLGFLLVGGRVYALGKQYPRFVP